MLTSHDRECLRRLAGEMAEAAALPVHQTRTDLWQRLNDLETGVRPLLMCIEICWKEFAAEKELRPTCVESVPRAIEQSFRRTLYQWRHLPLDMVIEPVFYRPVALKPYANFGLPIIEDSTIPQGRGDISSHGYVTQFRTLADADKITIPKITVDTALTAEYAETAAEAFGDLLAIRFGGVSTMTVALWDWIIMRWRVDEALLALVDEPELVHRVLRHLLDAFQSVYRQFDDLQLLTVPDGVYPAGSGGYGRSRDLPRPKPQERVRPRHQWGRAMAQIFNDVSPAMHEEFALRYEREWLEQFGLTYYGCCEALHNKIGILRSIKNLRKISASPWCDLEKMVEQTGRDYVISLKPNPAFLAGDTFPLAEAEKQLRRSLDVLRGVNTEIILKDISTVGNSPRRLWQWADMAQKVVQDY